MSKLKKAIKKFFSGRCGNDSLNYFVFFLYLLTFILYLIIKHYSLIIINTIFFIIFILRFMSRNAYRRNQENKVFVSIIKSIKRPFLRFFHKIRDHKTHVYKKCTNCKKVLRLRKVKGEHWVRCPICNQRFKIKI